MQHQLDAIWETIKALKVYEDMYPELAGTTAEAAMLYDDIVGVLTSQLDELSEAMAHYFN